MDSDSIALNFLNKLNSTDCAMWALERLDLFKWHDVINSNSWFLANIKRVFRLDFIQANFFLKINIK